MFASTNHVQERASDVLQDAMAEVVGLINAAQGRLVELIVEGLEQRLWQQPGIHSPEHWLSWQLGLSASKARQLLAIARRSAELPATTQALSAGELSVDQAAVIARHCPADHEKSVAEIAKAATVSQLSHALRRYAWEPPRLPDEPGADGGEPALAERRDVTFGCLDEHRWRVAADLPVDEGAVIERALCAAHADLIDQAKADGEPDRPITWADALASIAEHYLASGAAARPGTDRYQVIVHLDTNPSDPTGPGAASLHLGPALPGGIRRYLTCDGTLRAVAERDGVPISVGRRRRSVPNRVRHLVEHRDGGCRVPGCPATRQLHIHHVVHWEHGGGTDTDNLIALCPRHHRLHHTGGLGIAGNADQPDAPDGHSGIAFTDPDGRRLPPAGRPRPPDKPPGPAAKDLGIPTDPYQHPWGERLQAGAMHFNRNPSSSPPNAA